MTYLYLALAIAFEAGWALALKASDGFTRPRAAAATTAFYVFSLAFFALAVRRLDIGPAYAIWAGAGAAIIAAAGILWFHEPLTTLKVVSLALVIAGVVGLGLADAGSATHPL